MKNKKIRKLLFLIILLLISYGVFYNRFTIFDYFKLYGYKPSSLIVNLANQDTMTSYTQQIFYLNNPQFLNKSVFSKLCPNIDPNQQIVLGCYYPSENGIYILNINDAALNGIMQVTAAHEVLHGIYSRLSSSQKNYLDSLLINFYKNGLNDQRVKEEIAIYMKTEPNSVFDEMNSTFPTECLNLPPALNNFYKQFFTNRTKIVNYEQAYQNVFLEKKSTLQNYDNKLATLNSEINSEEANASILYNSLKSQLNYINSNSSDPNLMNLINQYNSSVVEYNSIIDQVSSQINQYNVLVVQRNQISLALVSLEKEISPPNIPQK